MLRASVSLAVLLLLASGVAGCTSRVTGLAGVSVSADGNLVIELASCGRHAPAQVVVYHSVQDLDQRVLTDMEFDITGGYARGGVATLTSIDTGAPADGWHLVQGTAQLDPTVDYSAFGTTGNNGYSTRQVRFTATDLAALQPGQVRYEAPDSAGHLHALAASRDAFQAAAAC